MRRPRPELGCSATAKQTVADSRPLRSSTEHGERCGTVTATVCVVQQETLNSVQNISDVHSIFVVGDRPRKTAAFTAECNIKFGLKSGSANELV